MALLGFIPENPLSRLFNGGLELYDGFSDLLRVAIANTAVGGYNSSGEYPYRERPLDETPSHVGAIGISSEIEIS